MLEGRSSDATQFYRDKRYGSYIKTQVRIARAKWSNRGNALMEIIVIGGSASKVGKTTLACCLIAQAVHYGRVVGLKVSTHPNRCDYEMSTYTQPPRHDGLRDTDRYLAAGASFSLLLDAGADDFRAHLAAGLRRARSLQPNTLVIESTSAGAELIVAHGSWFIAGTTPWKPSARKHWERAEHILEAHDVPMFASIVTSLIAL